MTGTTMMTLQQPALAQSNSLLGQRFEETRREVVRLRRTNEYLRETLSTHEHLIRLLEGIRECLERRNDDLMEVCVCKSFLRPENAHIANDDLNELYTQYCQVKSAHGLPVNLSTSTSSTLPATNGSSPEKALANGKAARNASVSPKVCHKRTPPHVDTSSALASSPTSSSSSSSNPHPTLPSPPSSSSLSPALSSSSAPSTGSSFSKLSALSSSAAAILSISAAFAAATATPSSPAPSALSPAPSQAAATIKAATSLKPTLPDGSSNGKKSSPSSQCPSENGDCPQTELKSDVEEESGAEEVKPIDLADRAAGEERNSSTGGGGGAMETDQQQPSSYIKKEEDEEDEDEEIEVDDIDDRYEEHDRKKGGKSSASFYDESATDDNSNDAKTVSETRLPILKSMLSPGDQQTEEKIEITLNPNDFFTNNTNDSQSAAEIDLSTKGDAEKYKSRQNVVPSSSSSSSENGREVSTSTNGFNVSSSSSVGDGAQPVSNAAAAAAALLAGSLHPALPPPSLPGMPGSISNLRIALSSKKPNVPSTMLATIAAANGLNINMDAIRPHKCHWPDCKFATKDRKTLRTHMRIHTKEKPFKCSFPNCSYETGDPSNYRKHKRRHIAHTIFACDFEGCNFTTNKPDFMQSHIAIHKGLKPFLCDFENCSSSFYTRSKLEAHRRKHLASGEFPMSLAHVDDKDKPIVCTYPNCGKRFINAAGLASHEVTHLATHNKYGAFLAEHEREKPVVCNFPNCGKRFLNTAGLAGHEVTHRNFISQNMGAIFKNLSFNQLKTLGIFSVANAKGQQQQQQSPQSSGANSNSSSPSPQQMQQYQQMMLAAQKSAESQPKEANGQVIVLDI